MLVQARLSEQAHQCVIPLRRLARDAGLGSRAGSHFFSGHDADSYALIGTLPSTQWAMICIGIGVSKARPDSSPSAQRTNAGRDGKSASSMIARSPGLSSTLVRTRAPTL